jgi:hypothetical protein
VSTLSLLVFVAIPLILTARRRGRGKEGSICKKIPDSGGMIC